MTRDEYLDSLTWVKGFPPRDEEFKFQKPLAFKYENGAREIVGESNLHGWIGDDETCNDCTTDCLKTCVTHYAYLYDDEPIDQPEQMYHVYHVHSRIGIADNTFRYIDNIYHLKRPLIKPGAFADLKMFILDDLKLTGLTTKKINLAGITSLGVLSQVDYDAYIKEDMRLFELRKAEKLKEESDNDAG